MGYETNFTLYADGKHEEINNLINAGKAEQYYTYLNSLDYYEGGLDRDHKDACWYGGSWKWYEHDDDMRALSAQFPTVTFTLEGVGEEHPDVWKKFYKGGQRIRQQRAVFTFVDEDNNGNVVHR